MSDLLPIIAMIWLVMERLELLLLCKRDGVPLKG